jgi:transposase InsO family protein
MDIYEELQYEIPRIREELKRLKEEQRLAEKRVRTAKHALLCAMAEFGEFEGVVAANEINPKKCRHEPDTGHRSGLGYSGLHCRKCRTLIVRDHDDEVIDHFYPEHPFKPGCRHPMSKRLNYSNTHVSEAHVESIVPLSTGGNYCKVCGACWEKG